MKSLALALGAALSTLAALGTAHADSNFYIGATGGMSNVAELKNVASRNNQFWLSAGAAVSDSEYSNREGSFKVFGGIQVSPAVAIELGYANLGRHRLTTHSTDFFDSTFEEYEWEMSSVFVDLVLTGHVGSNLALNGKIGYANTSTDVSYDYSDTIGGVDHVSQSKSKAGLKLGLGAEYAINRQLGLRLDLDWYMDAPLPTDLSISKTSVNVLSIGARYSF